MSLILLNKGWLCTLQDLGRPGYAHYGINRSGAMDPLALRIGNGLLGNALGLAALEMCFPGPDILFLEPATICLSGADFGAKLEEKPLAPHRPYSVPAGSTLRFTQKNRGQYGYLCVQGGFKVPTWLHSQSTNLKVQYGPWHGQALQKGSLLPFHLTQVPPTEQHLPYAAEPSAFYLQPFTVRYVKGQHFDLLPPESQARLHTQAWRISQASERMGYRLEAEALPMRAQVSLLSAGLSRGSIQLPPNGLPIVLMADHQTTGGYPVLGQVIEADWPKLAQMGPGQTLQFSPVDLWEALESLQAQERYVQRLAWAVKHNCIVAKKL